MFGNKAPIQLPDLFIDLTDETDGCYWPGDTITGRIIIATCDSSPLTQIPNVLDNDDVALELMSMKLAFLGYGHLNCNTKAPESVKELVYLNDESELIESTMKMRRRSETFFEFKKLHSNLKTSLVSKIGTVYYYVRVNCTYRTPENEVKVVCAARGITIVERFDLNCLPAHYFSPTPYNLVKKFGLFSCTGGHICLQFSIFRRAFVCGEHITIKGRIENKTDRRIDKVTAVLQQRVMIIGNTKNVKDLNIFDVCDICENDLALFVDEASTIKIERNFALPPLPPSTFTLNDIDPNDLTAKQMACASNRVTASICSSKSKQFSAFNAQNTNNSGRFLNVLYQLSVRVKTSGTELMKVNVPLIIGNVPREELQDTEKTPKNGTTNFNVQPAARRKSVLYLQNRKERPVNLAELGVYHANKSQLIYINRYPYYVDLPTSSKQSQKVSALAHAISNEVNIFRHSSTKMPSRMLSNENCVDTQSVLARGVKPAAMAAVATAAAAASSTPSKPTDSACNVALNVSPLRSGFIQRHLIVDRRPLSFDLAGTTDLTYQPKGAIVRYTMESCVNNAAWSQMNDKNKKSKSKQKRE